MLPLFYQIIVLFMILMVGFIIYRLRIVDDQLIAGISRLIMDVTLPAMIIISMSFDFSREILRESVQIFFITLGLYVFSWVLAIWITKVMKVTDKARAVYQFMLIFPNTGFMGFPVIDAIYGRLGIFYASICTLAFSLVVWTLGVWIFQKGEGGKFQFHWRIFLTPGIVATVIGFFIFIFSIQLPYPIFRGLDLLGGTTTPLSMLMVGAMMGRSSIKEIWQNGQLYLVSFIRLLFLPLLTLVIMFPFGFSEIMLGSMVVLMGMPAAANTAMFAVRYGGDSDLGSRGVFISTLFSAITIPLLVMILQML